MDAAREQLLTHAGKDKPDQVITLGLHVPEGR